MLKDAKAFQPRRPKLLWWLLIGAVLLAAAWLAADRWLLREADWVGANGILTEEELPGALAEGETFATGANFTVQKFPDNCTLSVEFGTEAVVGVSRDRERMLSFFFSSLVQDLSGIEALSVQFGDAPPLTLRVARVVTIVNVPVLILEVPTGLGRQWREAETLSVADGDKPIGRFVMGEAQTKAPDLLADCVNSL